MTGRIIMFPRIAVHAYVHGVSTGALIVGKYMALLARGATGRRLMLAKNT